MVMSMSVQALEVNAGYKSIIDTSLNARKADERSVSLYVKHTYKIPTNLTNVEVAYFDCRTNPKSDVEYLMRRYYDASYSAHPSVLVNFVPPTYMLIFVNDDASEERAVNILKNLKVHKSQSHVVMLRSGGVPSYSMLEPYFDAVYALPSKEKWAMDLLVQAFWGGIAVSKSSQMLYERSYYSISTPKIRLAYSPASLANMDEFVLDSVDLVMNRMISDGASPGGVVLIARQGRVVFHKTYGYATYKKQERITERHLYDIASLSKIVGTLPLVMNYNSLGVISLNDKLGDYLRLPDDKRDLSLDKLLLHSTGLPSGISSFLLCVDSASFSGSLYSRYRRGRHTIQIEPRLYMQNNVKLREGLFATEKSDMYPHVVAPNMFTTEAFRQDVMSKIDDSKMMSVRYRYSDLSFIYLQRVLEMVSSMPLNMMFDNYISAPLGICRMCYRPLERYLQKDIVPTEDDKFFRKCKIRGTVHDQTCALLGGVAGHAGLFATAEELAKIGQLYLNGGTYGGVSLFTPQVCELFTQRHRADNRRGYGFDKPEFRNGYASPVAECVPLSTYGHTGFSGTLMWMDPDNELLFIFLSNRICPNAYNTKLTKNNIRSDIHEIIYRSIRK